MRRPVLLALGVVLLLAGVALAWWGGSTAFDTVRNSGPRVMAGLCFVGGLLLAAAGGVLLAERQDRRRK